MFVLFKRCCALFLVFGLGLAVTRQAQAISLSLTRMRIPRVTIEAEGRRLGDVVHQVTLQSGVSVVVDKKWSDLQVRGSFKNVSLDEFFRRVLRGENYTIIFDDVGKLVSVQSFGKRSRFSYNRWSESVSQEEENDADEVESEMQPPLTSTGVGSFSDQDQVLAGRFFSPGMGLGPARLGGRPPVHHYSRLMAIRRLRHSSHRKEEKKVVSRVVVLPTPLSQARSSSGPVMSRKKKPETSPVGSRDTIGSDQVASGDDEAQIRIMKLPRADYLEVHHFFEREAALAH